MPSSCAWMAPSLVTETVPAPELKAPMPAASFDVTSPVLWTVAAPPPIDRARMPENCAWMSPTLVTETASPERFKAWMPLLPAVTSPALSTVTAPLLETAEMPSALTPVVTML